MPFLCSVIQELDVLFWLFIWPAHTEKVCCNQITTHKTYYNVAMNGHGPCQITTGLSINSALLLKEKCLEYSWYIREKFYCFDKKRKTLTLLLKEI